MIIRGPVAGRGPLTVLDDNGGVYQGVSGEGARINPGPLPRRVLHGLLSILITAGLKSERTRGWGGEGE